MRVIYCTGMVCRFLVLYIFILSECCFLATHQNALFVIILHCNQILIMAMKQIKTINEVMPARHYLF